MTYEDLAPQANGAFGIATTDERGRWVNAVEMDIGSGFKKFVTGPWKPEYGLGPYGLDTRRHTA